VYEDAAAADKERYAAEVAEVCDSLSCVCLLSRKVYFHQIEARGGVVATSAKKTSAAADGVVFPLGECSW
jgi:hypothetical protein